MLNLFFLLEIILLVNKLPLPKQYTAKLHLLLIYCMTFETLQASFFFTLVNTGKVKRSGPENQY